MKFVSGSIKRIFRREEVDCTEVRHRSSDYLDGDLPSGKLSRIRAHLDNCGPCRSFVDTLASTIGVLSRFPRVSAPRFIQKVPQGEDSTGTGPLISGSSRPLQPLGARVLALQFLLQRAIF